MSDCVTGSIDVMDVNLEQRKLIDYLRSKICEHNWHLLDPLDNLEQCTICRLYRDREAEYPSETQTRRIAELEGTIGLERIAAHKLEAELAALKARLDDAGNTIRELRRALLEVKDE